MGIYSICKQTKEHFVPNWNHLTVFRKQEEVHKKKQRGAYDRQHRVKELPALPDHATVWVKTGKSAVPGKVITKVEQPRSYLVEMQAGTLRRNYAHLGIAPETLPRDDPDPVKDATSSTQMIKTRLQTGTAIHPPSRERKYSIVDHPIFIPVIKNPANNRQTANITRDTLDQIASRCRKKESPVLC